MDTETMPLTFGEVLQRGDYLLLDTETTGIGEDHQIVQIAIVGADTHIYLDTLIKPTIPIPPEATEIHGITNEQVENAPTWLDVAPFVKALMKGRHIVIYNAEFDLDMMYYTSKAVGRSPDVEDYWPTELEPTIWCAMKQYSLIRKVSNRRGGYKWFKLSEALRAEGNYGFKQNHTALADCLMTLGLCHIMNKKLNGEGDNNGL